MTSEDLINLLRKDVASWNAWREQHRTEERLYFIEADLSNAQLQGANLQAVYLNHANFQGANLRGADFAHASLIKANLQEADLSEADFNSATLSSSRLVRTILHETGFFAADLERADFQEADMSEAVLEEADVSFASFYRANLQGAQLKSAKLHGTNLREADLSFADLREATLLGADLTQAQLQDTYLMGANFTSSILEKTDFSGAVMGLTILGDHDLRRVEGLEQVVHRGPSPLSVMTLYQSKGMLPLNFLRGTGLVEPFLSSVLPFLQAPFFRSTVSVSAVSEEEPFVQQLIGDLQARGIRCWYSRKDIPAIDMRDVIGTYTESCMHLQDLYFLIFSKSSIPNMSGFTKHALEAKLVPTIQESKAVRFALEREQQEQRTILFPIFLDHEARESSLPWVAELREQRRAFDFTNWQDERSYRLSFNVLYQKLLEVEAEQP